MIHFENGFTLVEMGPGARTIWRYPFDKLRNSSDDGKRLLWLDFGRGENEFVSWITNIFQIENLWMYYSWVFLYFDLKMFLWLYMAILFCNYMQYFISLSNILFRNWTLKGVPNRSSSSSTTFYPRKYIDWACTRNFLRTS